MYLLCCVSGHSQQVHAICVMSYGMLFGLFRNPKRRRSLWEGQNDPRRRQLLHHGFKPTTLREIAPAYRRERVGVAL